MTAARLMAVCVRHPGAVAILALIAAVAGDGARRRLAKDAVPDLADPRIVLVAEWMGRPATQVSAAITERLTAALDDVPGRTAVRGTSMAGMAFVDVVFGRAEDLERGRAEIQRRVEGLHGRLPQGAQVLVGPPASSTGWVFQYAVVDDRGLLSPAQLRRLQEEILVPALSPLAGVAEVATVGLGTEQLLVEVKPDKLAETGLALSDLVPALRAAPAAGAPAPPAPRDLGELQLEAGAGAGDGARLRIGDVARVRLAPDMPTGIADLGGRRPAIGGIVIARHGADPARVIAGVKEALAGARAQLPATVRVVTVCDRSALAARVEHTLLRALGEEIAVVVVVTLLFLLDARAALVPLLTLPLVLLLTFAGMRLCGVSATVMSLGGIGIALGMAVDAELVALEACHRRLEADAATAAAAAGALGAGVARRADRRARLAAAASSFAPAVLTSLVIAALTFLPVLAFTGETGRLLGPLAITKTLVIVSAALVTLTVAPVLRDRLLPGRVVPELGNPVTRTLVRLYRPLVHFALDRPWLTLVTAALAVLSCLPLLSRLGGEFFPRIDEGDLLFMPTTLPGVMPEDAAEQLSRQDAIIQRFGEVEAVLGKAGRADTATDPAPLSMVETTIHLKPRDQWPTRPRARWYSSFAPRVVAPALRLVWPEVRPATTAELVEEMDRATRLPGWTSAWTAPARARQDMMATGVRTPVGVRIVGPELDRLETLAGSVRAILGRVPGTRSVVSESLGKETWLAFAPDAEALARHGADPEAVQAAADLVISGGVVGTVGAGDGRKRRVPIRLVLDTVRGRDADRLREATVRVGGGGGAGAGAPGASAGSPVPLGLLGRPVFVSRPSVVHSERGGTVAYVHVDLEAETDLPAYLAAARRAIAAAEVAGELRLSPAERLEWTGQHELFAAGQRRLMVIVPLCAALMMLLLLLQFRSAVEALLVLSSVPFALVGSFWTLFALGYPLSAPVWVGLLSVVGLAMQTGVVMVVYIDDAFHRRLREGRIRSRRDIVAAHAEGSVQRLRPKVMTIATMAAGLLPLLWADGAGAEIMKRVAAPMLGGLVTSAFLTLEVLPVLYTIWRHAQLRRATRTARPLTEIVGRAPPWARG